MTRASTRGTAFQLSRAQYPELHATMTGYAQTLGLRRTPDLYLADGNGVLNAFAVQAFGHEFIVVANELFANLRRESQAGLRFILGMSWRTSGFITSRSGINCRSVTRIGFRS